MAKLINAGNIAAEAEKAKAFELSDFTIHGECSNCGQCCNDFIPMSAKEIKTIKRYIAKNNITEQVRFIPTVRITLDYSCPFRSSTEKKCLIYPVRPAICQEFQCNKSHKYLQSIKALYHRKYEIINMRKEFFSKSDD